jgi:hypothetical protein
VVNELIAAQIFLAKQAKNAVKAFWQNEQNEQAYLNRHVYVGDLQQYAQIIDAETFPKLALDIKTALQNNPDQRHWSQWSEPRRDEDYRPDQFEGLIAMAWAKMEQLERAILAAEGMERVRLTYEMKNVRQAIVDQGYITIAPEEFIEYDDGETLGYSELRYLLSIMEDDVMESPYATDEENHQFRLANAEHIAPEPLDSDRYLEDRGYEPSTFTPAVELDFADISKFLIDKDTRVATVIQTVLNRRPRLHHLFTGSYLSQAERYFAIKQIVSQACDTARAKGRFVYFEETFETFIEQAGLSEFAELYDEELSDRDPGGWYGITTDQDIMDMADHVIEQIIEAPAISLLITEVQRLWQQNRRQFPAPEKVISWRRDGKVHFRLKNEADYQTLGKLYHMAGLNIDGRLLHGHTPFYQRHVIQRIAAGASIGEAYKLTKADYLAYRHGAVAHPATP